SRGARTARLSCCSLEGSARAFAFSMRVGLLALAGERGQPRCAVECLTALARGRLHSVNALHLTDAPTAVLTARRHDVASLRVLQSLLGPLQAMLAKCCGKDS